MRRISLPAAPAALFAVLLLAGCPQPLPRSAPAEPPQAREQAAAVQGAPPFVRAAEGKKFSSPAPPAALFAVFLLAGCPQPLPSSAPAEPPQAREQAAAVQEAPPFVRQAVGDADRLMGYYAYLSTLSAEQLVQEH